MPTKSANNAIELSYINYIAGNNSLNFTATPISSGSPIVDATAGLYANGAFLQANAAFNSANNVAPQIEPAFGAANSAGLYANASFLRANASFIQANAAYNTANNAGGIAALPNILMLSGM